jgi:hypothetical protein
MSFHVFLSHSSADKPAVEELARRLAKEGIQGWLDKWHLIPGDTWQAAIAKALAESETCAVFVGPSGMGPWQNEEMRAAIDRRVDESDRRFRVIPVLLPGAERAERSSLPTFLAAMTWVEFRDSLDDADAFHRLLCGIRGVEPGPGPGQAFYEGQCPYRGLRVFDVNDAAFFFGRGALVQWLLNEVRPATEGKVVNRFLAILGASGSGKSSVARAGMAAELKHDAIPGSSRWPIAIFRPGSDPLESLAVALSKVVNVAQGASGLTDLIEELQRNEKTLHLTTRQSLPENASAIMLVILVDQFEEVFTLCRNEDLREAFIRNLLYAAKVAQGQTLVILTMRADFYAKCAANADLAAAFSDHHVLVGPMTDDELRRAIERPTQLVGCELESGLVDLLMQDVRRQGGALPLLQHALLELWNKREGRRLTVKAYQEIGKLEGALQRRADATFEAFSEDEKELCRRTFLRLTQPGEGTEDTKRRASMQELVSLSGASSAEEDIVQKLATACLLTTKGDLSRNAFVEVAHEALIRSWPLLRKWIEADRAGLRTRTRLTEAARDWKNAGRDPAYLYTGARLVVAKEWEVSHPGELSADEAEFLRCSLETQKQREASELEAVQKLAEEQKQRAELSEQREKEQKEAARKLRRLAIGAFSAAGAALILLVIVATMSRSVQQQARIAAFERRAKAPTARTFQGLPDLQDILVLGTDHYLWLEQAPFGTVPPVRQRVDNNVQAFQAMDTQLVLVHTQHVLVLGIDGKLWLEQAPFGKIPPVQQQIDKNVRAFQAVNENNIFVLGTDEKLWLEHAPFGNLSRRQQVDAKVLAFQAVNENNIFVLGTDGKLWLEQGPFRKVPPSRQQIGTDPQTFQAMDIQTVLVLGMDGNLWLEQAPFGHIPPVQIDGNVEAFQALNENNIFVLGTDGKLWLEYAPFVHVPPDRQLVDAYIQAFQANDIQRVLVLGIDGSFWLEYAPFGQVPNPNRKQVDANVLSPVMLKHLIENYERTITE